MGRLSPRLLSGFFRQQNNTLFGVFETNVESEYEVKKTTSSESRGKPQGKKTHGTFLGKNFFRRKKKKKKKLKNSLELWSVKVFKVKVRRQCKHEVGPSVSNTFEGRGNGENTRIAGTYTSTNLVRNRLKEKWKIKASEEKVKRHFYSKKLKHSNLFMMW